MNTLIRVTNEIFTIPDLLSESECQRWVERSEASGFEPALVAGTLEQVRRDDIRNNDRLLLDDSALANDLWQRVAHLIPTVASGWKPVGLNERMRVYRYDPGQRFKWHSDGRYCRPNGEQSQLTFMVYLNEGFTGGETLFRDARIAPRRGMALLFCHWLKHMGDEVREGRKYVLRSDVMFARVAPSSGQCSPEATAPSL